jgi:UDP-N-acetylglucosamine acyltransferase
MTVVHPTAVVSPGAELGADVEIGPYCVVGPHVKIGDRARLMSHVVLDGWTTIGSECALFPFACIGTQTQDLKYKGGKTFVEIGSRTTLREYVTVNSSTNEGETTRVGAGCHIMACCHVGHACRVGDGVIMANATGLAGHVIVEDQAVLGGMSGVHQFVKVGRMCMIGGLTKVTQDCPPFMIVDGNPAGVRGLNSVALERRNVDPAAQRALKDAYRILYREGLSTRQAVARIRADLAPSPELEHLLRFVETSERGIVK